MHAQSNLLKAVRQALYHISRGNPIPRGNRLLSSPVVLDFLERQGLPDTPEAREEAVISIFREIVNEYGLEQPEGRRRQKVHKRIFELLSHLLRGQFRNLDIPKRSYERYHAQAIRILAEKWREKEELLLRNPGDPPPELQEARRRAQELLLSIQQNKSVVDLLALIDLEQAATIIANYDYPVESGRYFAQILSITRGVANNLVTLSLKARVSNKMAHALMNQGKVWESINYFKDAVALATEIGDWEIWVHATHMLGVTYNMAGDWRRSLYSLGVAHRYATRTANYRQRVAWIQRDMIASLLTKGDFDDIPSLAKSSLSVREALSDYQGVMMTLEIWGRALIAQERFKEAQAKLLQALGLADSVSSKLFHTILYVTLAQLYYAWGKLDEFHVYSVSAKKIALQCGLLHQLARLENIPQQGTA